MTEESEGKMKSLEEEIRSYGGPIALLRDRPIRRFQFPYPGEITNWQDEQRSWTETAALFDQSHHMTDVYIKGPDVWRLLSETGVNNPRTYGEDRAKHFIACAPDGNMIGTAILFGLGAQQASLVGPSAAANWVQYQAEAGGYDVTIERDERTADGNPRRRTFRYEVQGPKAWRIVEKAHGGRLDNPGFFRMMQFAIEGRPVRALVHTMVGVPGDASMGLEIFGDVSDGDACLDALMRAGEEFGLVRAGALAYYTGATESGYLAQPVPAIYAGDGLSGYRSWLKADGYEARLSVGGSFEPSAVDEYYFTPWDFGYGHVVHLDHEFIGRDALAVSKKESRLKKVWLRWNDDDVTQLYADSLFAGHDRPKYLETPLSRYARVQYDAVLSNDAAEIGVSAYAAYTVNAGSWFTVALIDERHARDGEQVEILWGESGGGSGKRTVERHVQRTIRATVSTESVAK